MTKLSQVKILLNAPINFGLAGVQAGALEQYPDSSYIKLLTQISNDSEVDIIYFRTCIEVWGLQSNIKVAYKKLSGLDWIKSKSKEIIFQFELGEADREFIKGKRDGKLTKITNSTHCSWHMHESHNGYNFLMDLKDHPNQNPLITFGLFEVSYISSINI